MEIANRLTMSRALVSARIAPESAESYAWMWVFPFADGSFGVSTVEIPRRFIDGDLCFAEDDIKRVSVAVVTTLDEVDSVLTVLGFAPDALEPPWKNDFPL